MANTQAAAPSDEAIVKAARHIKDSMAPGGYLRAYGQVRLNSVRWTPSRRDGGIVRLAKMSPVSQPPPPQPVDVEPYVPTLRDAVASAQPYVWPVGYNPQTQKLAAYKMLTHHHAGIVGSSGTGKTSGVGFLMVSHALRQNVHTVILDGDGGASWAGFAPYTEHIPTDDYNLPDMLRTLEKEMDRRVGMLASRTC